MDDFGPMTILIGLFVLAAFGLIHLVEPQHVPVKELMELCEKQGLYQIGQKLLECKVL